MRLASSVSRLASSFILDRSATSVTRASPAKCPTFPGGTPRNQTSVGPSASSSSMYCSRSLNLPSVAAFGGGLERIESAAPGGRVHHHQPLQARTMRRADPGCCGGEEAPVDLGADRLRRLVQGGVAG